MKMKQWIGVLLCMLLCVGILPTTASAAEDYKVLVDGVWITSDNADDVLGDGSVIYDKESNTVTLNNAILNGNIYCQTNSALNIVVNGTNTMTCTGDTSTGISNFANNPINISGNGELTITVEKTDGKAISGSDITIDGTTLKLYTHGTALYGYPLTLKNGANVTAELSEGSYNIAVDGSSVEIINSTLTATSPLGNSITGDSIKIENSTVTGTGSYPIMSYSGDITIIDSTVKAASTADWGIWSSGNLLIKGNSDITATGSIAALGASNSFMLEPPAGGLIDVFTGSDEDNASAIDNSPLSQETDLGAYGNDSIKYFHSASHKHIYDQQIVNDEYKASDATCTEPAKYYQSCVCGAKGTETFENGSANGHTWGSWTGNGDGTHSRTCSVCGDTESENCSGGTATCSQLAVCDICGEEYGEITVSNHTNLVKTEAKPATHMTEGNIEYWYCDGCDKYFSDEAGTKEIALADTVIPKLTEHTADGTGWHSDETNHWNTCECGEKLNEAAHTFEWVTDKEATATEAGLRHEKCTVCGYEKAAVEIPATGTTEDPSEPPTDTDKPSGDQTGDKDNPSTGTTGSPQTGDNSNIALWIAIMLAAGVALTGTAVYSRKRKYSK